MKRNTPIRMTFADDYPAIRTILRALLAADQKIQIVGEATTGTEMLDLCRTTQPAVALLDLHMPGPMTPLLVLRLEAEAPEARILIVSEEDDDVYVRAMARLPIGGYILKADVPDYLLDAIHAVAGGTRWYSPSLRSVVYAS